MTGANLLSIPPELRLRIFNHLLVTDIDMEWPSEGLAYDLHPALLRTCKQIYSEAAPLLYAENSFVFNHPSDCNIFVHLKDRNYAHRIRCVLFRIRDRDFYIWIDWLASNDLHRCLVEDLPNLERLMIFYRHSAFWTQDRPAREQFVEWTRTKRLVQLCMNLEKHPRNKLKGLLDKTLVMVVNVSQVLFDALQHHFVLPQGQLYAGSDKELRLVAPGVLRTSPYLCYDTQAYLELVGPVGG